jgi:hypothetical protein
MRAAGYRAAKRSQRTGSSSRNSVRGIAARCGAPAGAVQVEPDHDSDLTPARRLCYASG